MRAPGIRAWVGRHAALICGTIVVLGAFVAYHDSLGNPFVFDDIPSIVENPSIRRLWPLGPILAPSGADGLTVSGRPVLNLSLAVNYAMSGLDVWSYHALNLLIHALAGLALFGVLRRTLRGAADSQPDNAPGGFPLRASIPAFLREEATSLSFAAALLWTVHPLQTESVAYVIQRAESLMGLFFLLTLYCFIRSATGTADVANGDRPSQPARQGCSPRGRPAPQSPGCPTALPSGVCRWLPLLNREACHRGGFRGPLWAFLSVLSCALATGTKEVAAVAPLVVLLYDRTFIAGSIREAWRRRRAYYIALALTWVPVAAFLATTGWNRGGSAGFDIGIPAGAYWLTQFPALIRYLSVSVWPHPLIFENGAFSTSLAEAIPGAVVGAGLAAATLVGLWRRAAVGFLGAWVFLLLAPTSVVPGAVQMIVEHRMYLPLASVISAGLIALRVLAQGLSPGRGLATTLSVALALALPLAGLTIQRNRVYRSDLALWSDTVAKSPESAVAQCCLATAQFHRGEMREAAGHNLIALRLNPSLVQAHYNLGLIHQAMGDPEEASARFAAAIHVNPRFFPAYYQSGITLLQSNRIKEAGDRFEQVVDLVQTLPESQREWAQHTLGLALFHLGRVDEAVSRYREALRLQPDRADVESDLGAALFHLGRVSESMDCFRKALQIDPKMADAHFNLGLACQRLGRPEDALEHYAAAVRIAPRHAAAQINLGIGLAQAGRLPESLVHLEAAVRLLPELADARSNLGVVLAACGRWDEAIAEYRHALRLGDDSATVHYNLGKALMGLRRFAEAKVQFEEALRLDPQFYPARAILDSPEMASPTR